jgi:putative ATPase
VTTAVSTVAGSSQALKDSNTTLIKRETTVSPPPSSTGTLKRVSEVDAEHDDKHESGDLAPLPKRVKVNHLAAAAPLAERLRPKSLDDVCGQALVGTDGVLRGLINAGRVPSMILWGSPGSGKTTIARLIASTAQTRFVEVNSASTGVAECKKLFAQAQSELGLTGRRTIMFCDEIHRFSRSQQDVLLGPIEAGVVTLIGATTSNPSFSLTGALLSRCRMFVLNKLTEEDVVNILQRAVDVVGKEDDTVSHASLWEHLSSTHADATCFA